MDYKPYSIITEFMIALVTCFLNDFSNRKISFSFHILTHTNTHTYTHTYHTCSHTHTSTHTHEFPSPEKQTQQVWG